MGDETERQRYKDVKDFTMLLKNTLSEKSMALSAFMCKSACICA
jgi:hypothetical protein